MNQNKQQLATPFDNWILTNKTKPIEDQDEHISKSYQLRLLSVRQITDCAKKYFSILMGKIKIHA